MIYPGIRSSATSDLQVYEACASLKLIPIALSYVLILALFPPDDGRIIRIVRLDGQPNDFTDRCANRRRTTQDSRRFVFRRRRYRRFPGIGRVASREINLPWSKRPRSADRRVRNKTRRDPQLVLGIHGRHH